MPRRPFISLTFAEGHYFDLWMLVHFLSGVAGGFSNVFWSLSFGVLLLVAVAMMIGWEILEFAMGVRESLSNVVLDVFVGMAGVLLAASLATRLSHRGEVVAFVATLSTASVLATLGALAAKRRRKRAS
jgi:hypothetical protein